MRGEGQVLLARGVPGDLAPLLGILQARDLAVEVVEVSNRNLAHVAANDEVSVLLRVADRPRLLVGWVEGHGTGSDGLDLGVVCRLVVGNCAFAVETARAVVVHEHLIIVGGCDHFVLAWDELKTPDFAFKVRLNQTVFSRVLTGHHVFELDD